MDSIIVSGTIEERDFVGAQLLHLRPSLSALCLLGLYALGSVLIVGATSRDLLQGNPVQWWALMQPASVLLILGVWRYSVRAARLAYREHKALHGPMVLEISSDGISSKTEVGQDRLPWSHFVRLRENKHLFVIYQTRHLITIIPKRLLGGSEDEASVREMVRKGLSES
jgi:hypothetical protein